ncbi:hypothetical protein NECAME_01989 [Necator americanus]|uniref:Uncharacterized protein n=1 Tax=Necator americanus TaxID=51031 RepID=W2TMN5_NECAM|nr:hypothetical protein NECAME_01989 [Necator americanus]ETN82252.1 hypothetical protein NECAME_01989 [Necator americanus]
MICESVHGDGKARLREGKLIRRMLDFYIHNVLAEDTPLALISYDEEDDAETKQVAEMLEHS